MMRFITFILLIIIGFLFLHSETGIFKDCADHHEGHDVCSIFQNSDKIRTSSLASLNNITQLLNTAFIIPLINISNYLVIPNSNKSDFYPHRLKNKKLIHFLSSLLI
jgi:1,4-dihydroxy-2-naphthoate octaprenyltransferase